jgi:pheromone shutdown protein TraB
LSEIRLVGTAHVSAQSVEDVRKAIEEFHPDIVTVELDLARFEALRKVAKDPSVDDVLEVRNFNLLLIR